MNMHVLSEQIKLYGLALSISELYQSPDVHSFSKYTLFMFIHLFVLPSVMARVCKHFASAILFHTFFIDSKKIKWELQSLIYKGTYLREKPQCLLRRGIGSYKSPLGSRLLEACTSRLILVQCSGKYLNCGVFHYKSCSLLKSVKFSFTVLIFLCFWNKGTASKKSGSWKEE